VPKEFEAPAGAAAAAVASVDGDAKRKIDENRRKAMEKLAERAKVRMATPRPFC
jgi:hypothetical protein